MPIRILVNAAKDVRPIKLLLESRGLLNKTKKISHTDYGFVIDTTAVTKLQLGLEEFDIVCESYSIESDQAPSTLEAIIRKYYSSINREYTPELVAHTPKRWTVYHPLVLFSANSFDSCEWQRELDHISSNDLFHEVCEFLGVTHAAINKPISNDDVKRIPSNITPLYGDFGPAVTTNLLNSPLEQDFDEAFWCHTTQNGIQQTWAPMYTMFSRGNIKEKKRILDTCKHLKDSWVLDLYAGIGYFTLSYLKNGGRLLCWELNPWSVQALVRNCRLNKFKYKLNDPTYDPDTQVYVFNASNELAFETVSSLLGNGPFNISHINLGLLPSSQQSWPITNQFLGISSAPTIVHVHENVHKDAFSDFSETLISAFPHTTLKTIEKVKTFAPDIWHVVFDIQLVK